MTGTVSLVRLSDASTASTTISDVLEHLGRGVPALSIRLSERGPSAIAQQRGEVRDGRLRA